ncbi:MAG: hypothetical protein KZQ64_09305 [gamma proteobacterium symbiont of Bathyaustriella thionipta]|nr:hypothetical protein [gamma proteobacterium symbiont of Bathyaustriella thionipta]MCU7949481.1 hypothetical protein [gamma proteobacterium symbiont of Bathyaustriella thionipta]MCU7953571.1 hypothetical protein [gamma proteobacterium symbiont of Bathyaustriella thionipta]MCU7955927.1 hypothetical protein [gamma proteobacterium symbiont of Bathyaustriella thionipta]MCU7967720.1 hypothetical protein [gamma proteobacterium symbiont of Bathyaustriella thionipta]
MTNTFKEAFYFFRKNLLQLLTYTFSIGIVVILLAQLLVPLFFGGMSAEEISPETIKPFAQLLNLLIKPIYTGGLIVLIFSLATAQNKGVFNSLLAGIMRWPYMLIANVLTSLMIFFGLMALFVPGIWLFSRLFLVPYLVMLKNQTPFEAVFNSFQYTKGYSMTILTDVFFLVMVFIFGIVILSVLQLLHPLVILLFLLLFQTMAYVVYYRHYEILLDKNQNHDIIETNK